MTSSVYEDVRHRLIDDGPLINVLIEPHHVSNNGDVSVTADGFDPSQERDEHGRWLEVPGSPGVLKRMTRDVTGKVVPGGVQNLAEFDQRVKKAKTGKKALKAARGTSELSKGDKVRWAAAQVYQANSDNVNFPLRGLIATSVGGKTTPQTLGPRETVVVQKFDEMMYESPLTDDVVVLRGIANPRKIFSNKAWFETTPGFTDNSGLEWRDLGYVSTTTSPKIAEHFARTRGSGSPVIMRILVPKGTPALRAESDKFAQQELILGRGYRYRLVRDHGVDRKTGIRNVDVEVITPFTDPITAAATPSESDLFELVDVPDVDFETQPDPPGDDWLDRFIDDGPSVEVLATAHGEEDSVTAAGGDDHWREQPRNPATGEWVKSPGDVVEDVTRVLDAPPLDLTKLTDIGDPRADALWFITGDNRSDLGGKLGYTVMNDYLRHGHEDEVFDGEFLDERVAEIDSAMRDSRLSRSIEVYRGMPRTDFLGAVGELEGREFRDRAFVSTTTDRAHAHAVGGTVLRIRVPAGVGAIRMADRDPKLVESEVLLDRGLVFRITREHVDRDASGRVVRHELDVEVVL